MNPMIMKKWLLFLIVVFSAAPDIPAYAEDSSQGSVFHALIGPDGTQHVRILGGSYFFKPKHIIVKVNVPVELSISREWGIVPHTFVLKVPEWGVMIDESLHTDAKTVTFTPTTVGKFPFYCKNKLLFFESHREKGMEGVIEVIQ